MAIKIKVIPIALEEHINIFQVGYSAIAEEEYKKALKGVLHPIATRVKHNAPVFSGALRGGIWSRVSGIGSFVTGRISTGKNTWYGNVVEFGRYKTGKQPPAEIIASKFNVSLREGFAIARSIAKHTANARKPVFYFEREREATFKAARQAIIDANEIIVARLAIKAKI